MKTFALIVAIGAMCIGPTNVFSTPSYGARSKAVYDGMVAFCYQAQVDSEALGQPMSPALAKVCAQ